MAQSHTATEQWQSFELRMRRRRIERCVARARAALATGALDEAREAIDEAARLDPFDETVKQLAASIQTATPIVTPQRVRPAPVVESAAPRIQPAAAARIQAAAAPEFESIGMLKGDRPAVHRSGAVAVQPAVAVQRDEASDAKEGVATSRLWFVAAALVILASGAAGWYWTQSRITAVPTVATTPALTSPAEPPRPQSPAIEAGSDSVPLVDGREAAVQPSERIASDDAEPEPPAGTSGETQEAAMVAAASPAAPFVQPAAAENRAATQQVIGAPATVPAVSVPAPSTDDPPVNAVSEPPQTTASTRTPAALPSAPPLPPPPAAPLPAPVGEALAETSAPVALTTPATPASPAVDEQGVRGLLTEYEAAYTRLDAGAVSTIWPSVDRRALADAFDGLASQSVRLGRCDVRLSNDSSKVECRGSHHWTPKIGGAPQLALRRWEFELKHTGSDWIIVSATVRRQ